MRVLFFFFRRILLSGKRLNIFSPTTDKDVESTPGNDEFRFFCKYPSIIIDYVFLQWITYGILILRNILRECFPKFLSLLLRLIKYVA